MKSCISQCTIKNNGNWTKTELNLRVFMKFQLHFIPPCKMFSAMDIQGIRFFISSIEKAISTEPGRSWPGINHPGRELNGRKRQEALRLPVDQPA